jgi:hypothetical protein
MDRDQIVEGIDALIRSLAQARALLTGHTAPLKRGFPPKSGRREISAESRARMTAAQGARRRREKARKS